MVWQFFHKSVVIYRRDWCLWILCQWYIRCLGGKYRKWCSLPWRRIEILSLKYFSSNNKNEIEAIWTCEGRGNWHFLLRKIRSFTCAWNLFTRLLFCTRNQQKKKLPPSLPQPKLIELNREKASHEVELTLDSNVDDTELSACVQISSRLLLMWK